MHSPYSPNTGERQDGGPRFARPRARPIMPGGLQPATPPRSHYPDPVPQRPGSGYGLFNFLQGLIAILLIATVGFGGTFMIRYAAEMQLVLDTYGLDGSVSRVARSALGTIDEQPAFASVPGAPTLPLCNGVSETDARELADAMNLMRRTSEGDRLFDQLLSEGVCVGVEEISYNSGYALARETGNGDWSSSYIMADRDILDSGETDVLAALLVHEATHIDRFVNGIACTFEDQCATLPNGVDLDEEIAAHAAEAEWWREAYGDDGKRFALGYAYGMNQLLKAYLDAPEEFAAYVEQLRGDEREGRSARNSG
jgi:hypothetical protein